MKPPLPSSPSVPRAFHLSVLALTFLLLLAKAAFLFVPVTPHDPLESPYLMPDSADWLSAGLELAGYGTSCEDLPPVIPAVYAVLYRLGLERFIETLHQLFFFGFVGAMAWLSWAVTRDRTLAALAAFLSAASGSIWYQAQFILVDVPVTALAAATAACLIGAAFTPRRALAFCGLFAVTLGTHAVFPLLAPAFLLYLLAIRKRSPSRIAWRLAVAGLFVSPLAFLVYHLSRAGFGTGRAPDELRHLSFFGPFVQGLFFYPWATLAMLGPLVLVLPLFVLDFLREDPSARRVMLLVWAVTGFLFFAIGYRFLQKRFVLYFSPPLLILMAWALLWWARRCATSGWRGAFLASLAPLAVPLWFGSLGPRAVAAPDFVLAPGIALKPSRPPAAPRNPNYSEFADIGFLDRSCNGDCGFVYGYLSDPRAIRGATYPGAPGAFESIDEILQIVRACPRVREGRLGLEKQVGDLWYAVSAAFRNHVEVVEAHPASKLPGQLKWLLVPKPFQEELPGFRKVLETSRFELYERSVSERPESGPHS